MKIFGTLLLVSGFIWIALDTAEGFVGYQHARWIWQTQHLPEGESIKRDEASKAMRDLSLALKDRHRVLFVPAAIMLAGGLLAAFSKQEVRPVKPE